MIREEVDAHERQPRGKALKRYVVYELLQADAETKGFEPLVGLLRRTLSKRVRSTTPARFLLTYLTFVVE